REQATRRLRQLRAGRPWGRIGTARVLLMGRVAARAGLTDEVDAALAEIVRRNVPPGLRLRAALELSGAGDDTHILALLEGVHDRPGNIGLQAAYHRARTLHRLGRAAEAEIAFLEVIERDRGITPFYAMWSELQLDDVRASMIGSCLPDATCGDEAAPEASAVSTSASTDASASTDTSNTDASASTVESNPDAHPGAEAPVGVEAMAGASEEHAEQVVQTLPESPLVSLPAKPEGEIGAVVEEEAAPSPNLEAVVANFTPTQPQELDVERAIETLAPLAEEYGDAYPWFGRAHDYLLIGEVDEAGRQLYEAFLAWREASGRPIRRTGRESVARGDNRPRQFLGWELKRKRRELTGEARLALADVGVALGDIGVSTGFGGWDRVAERPRAYAAQVEAAASRHGLDPNLLFAIMRVESVYQKEIVSYAGAIGLCQIMPRTGQLIANSLHRSDYTAADLLDPETNLEFAAWYLRSLIERFDGRVPLAIASYNGGPHNVRQWMASQPEDMPLDVFLEHIPFEQTHRYVRRVLTHYRAYRAQQGLPMISLSTDLPAVRTDTVAF
ncbi:MAG: lytic transglycosylase domain-containing protein, partial [Myxococcota bacterium]